MLIDAQSENLFDFEFLENALDDKMTYTLFLYCENWFSLMILIIILFIENFIRSGIH